MVRNQVMNEDEANQTLDEKLSPIIELHGNKGKEELRKVEVRH